MSISNPVTDEPKSAEDIRLEMAELRCQLREDFVGAAAQAKKLTDWKRYVEQAPWVALGVTALAAFAIVPRKMSVTTVGTAAAEHLAKQNKVVVTNRPEAVAKGGMGGFLVKTATAMAVRSLMGIATQKVTEMQAAKKQPSSPPPQQP